MLAEARRSRTAPKLIAEVEPADPGTAAIEALAVSKMFGEGADTVQALQSVTVVIRQNEFFTLLGPSGCGKTTLLRLVAGFDDPTSGSLRLDGTDITVLPPFKRPVNTVFQSYALFPHMTVAENVGFGLKMLGRPKVEIDDTVEKMLALVRMSELRSRRTDQISGGQQQRVALARALAPRPKVLLLDEPLSALDYKLRKNMQIELKRLQSETGITFVFVTHDQEEALTMSDRLAVMNQGRILQVGTPREIYDRPSDRFVADFIGDTNFLHANLVSIRGTRGLLQLVTGSEVEVDVPEGVNVGTVTVVVRPERAKVSARTTDAQLTGELRNIVYFGTDTHYHVALQGRGEFVVRVQNARGGEDALETNRTVGLSFAADSIQILRD